MYYSCKICFYDIDLPMYLRLKQELVSVILEMKYLDRNLISHKFSLPIFIGTTIPAARLPKNTYKGIVRLMFMDDASFARVSEPSACWCERGIPPTVPYHRIREYVMYICKLA
jgi:hypothetical protein